MDYFFLFRKASFTEYPKLLGVYRRRHAAAVWPADAALRGPGGQLYAGRCATECRGAYARHEAAVPDVRRRSGELCAGKIGQFDSL